jgi:asparagine synthase (glutamine-hydrolysing)
VRYRLLEWKKYLSMCGIAGFWLHDAPASLETVRAMCDQIRYRGPDDEGYHLDGGCALGMRRLSIIDLATGHQPISNEDGSVWIVFNGEIYNFQELRRRLIDQGHRFQTNSDTETIVHLYEQEGVEGLERLRGMFAFAIWDARRRQLLLARDRLGKKPLYYAHTPRGLWFASEMKCLRSAGVPEDLDAEALRLYFQFSYIPDPWTPFSSIRKLPPGTWLVALPDGSVRQGRYWSLPPPTEHFPAGQAPPSEPEVCESLRNLFDESVRMRMIADVPLGAFLSGGIDSSAVVASMALQSPDPVKTFSIGFREAAFNELEYAGMVARQYHTEHHEILVQPDSVSLVPQLVRHFDEPFGDSSAIPTFLVSEFAAQHVKVVLSGDGGDELFAGYESFADVEKRRIFDRLPRAMRRLIATAADALPYAAYGKNYLRMMSRPTALERYFESNYSPYYLRKELLAPDWMLPTDAAYLTRTFGDCLLPESADILSQAMYFEATVKLPGEFLVKVDRMSMANSLEVRCPLLDHQLAEFAARIPNAWKLSNGKGKRVFLRALGNRLPAPLLNRPKMGFGMPLANWFRTSLREMLWDHLTSSRFLDRGMVTPTFLRYLLEEHQSGRRDNSSWLWQLLFLELWFREVEQPKLATVPG